MVRTQIYLTEAEQEGLRALSRRTGQSQSELIRQAIDASLTEATPEDRASRLRSAHGLWRDRSDLPDFRALRGEFERAKRSAR